jgi:hypothetical protein
MNPETSTFRPPIAAGVVALLIATTALPNALEYIRSKIPIARMSLPSAEKAILFDKKVVNVGEISGNTDFVEADYGFINKTSQRVRVTETIVNCGCTEAKFDNDWINPNDRGSIVLKYVPHYKPSKRGPFDQVCLVRFAGSQDKYDIPIRIVGQIVEDLVIDPPAMDLGDFHSQGHIERTVRVTNHLQSSAEIQADSDGNDLIIFDPAHFEIEPGQSRNVRLILQVKDDAKALNCTVHFSTSASNNRLIKIPMMVLGRPHSIPVYADADEVLLGFCRRTNPPQKALLLKSTGPSFEIVGVRSEGVPMTASFERMPAASHVLNLSPSLSNVAQVGKISGKLVVTVHYQDRNANLEIPTSAFINDPEKSR